MKHNSLTCIVGLFFAQNIEKHHANPQRLTTNQRHQRSRHHQTAHPQTLSTGTTLPS